MTAHALQLETAHGTQVALQSVSIESVLNGRFGHTTISQRFVNTETVPIEAVYTFPTPHRAVFMGLEVTIGNKTLAGVVVSDAKADRGYEEAIQDGDAAVLLREVEQGLFSVSVGNILPGEAIALKYTYAEQVSQQGDTVRLIVPTTIASRYGCPSAIGLEPHELITHKFGAGYALSLSVTIAGGLAHSGISSPSHAIQTRATDTGVFVTLSTETTAMDRDFVLTLSGATAMDTRGIIAPNLTARNTDRKDDGQWVAAAPFYLPVPGNDKARTGVFNLIIDCSGSMGGDSIRLAKAAALEILGNLHPEDRINLTAFGFHAESAFAYPLPASEEILAEAKEFVASLRANMGGTEIGEAIAQACPDKASTEDNANVLLITDGQTYDGNNIIEHHRHRGHRIFTLGVGSAVSSSFLEQLADATGGACELVAPNEHMAEHIVRHFGRMRQLRVVSGEIHWGQSPIWSVPEDMSGVFAGDTLHVGAGFTTRPEGDASLTVHYEDGTSQRSTVSLEALSDDCSIVSVLPRVLAHQRLNQFSEAHRIAAAIDYQLLTDGTKCLMTHQRPDGQRAEELPALRQVPHEQPAGWGGTGSVYASPGYGDSYDLPPNRVFSSPKPCMSMDMSLPPSSSAAFDSIDDSLDIPSFLRRSSETESRKTDKEKPDSVLSRRTTEANQTSIKTLGISRDLRWKLAGKNIHTVEELLGIPKSEWEFRFELTDQEIASLLRALRNAGHKAR